MTRKFTSLREALRYMDAMLTRGDVRAARKTRGGAPPDEWTAVAVLAAMQQAGCPWGSPVGRGLVEWANGDDDEFAPESQVRAALAITLETHELLEPRSKIVFGRRIHRIGDRYLVTLVANPDPTDPTIFYGSRKDAIAFAEAAGTVIEAVVCTPKDPTAAAREEAARMHEVGRSAAEIDAHVARLLCVSERSARRYRVAWGLNVGPTRGGATSTEKKLLDDRRRPK